MYGLAEALFKNALLKRLSAEDLALLGPIKSDTLDLHQVLHAADTAMEYVYFPETSLASIVGPKAMGMIEVGLVGAEGMTGTSLVLGDRRSPFETIVQGAGVAIRVGAQALQAAIEVSPSLRALLSRYVDAFNIQIAATSIANGKALLEMRLARWLLMVGDRRGDKYQITHEFLAIMLSVRRSGVTVALQALEGHGLIRSTRGAVAILDREGLIERANGFYGLAEREYARLLGKD